MPSVERQLQHYPVVNPGKFSTQKIACLYRTHWAEIIEALRNSNEWSESLQKNGQLTIETPNERYQIFLTAQGININYTLINIGSWQALRFRITHSPSLCELFEYTSKKTRIAEIKEYLGNSGNHEPVYYPGKTSDDVLGFQESEDFFEFRKQYIATVQELTGFVESINNAFKQFIERVFPAEEHSPNLHVCHQLYQLKKPFEKMLAIMKCAHARLGKGSSSAENQQYQDSFDLSRGIIASLQDELDKCAEGVVTYTDNVLLKLNADNLNTPGCGLIDKITNAIMPVVDAVIKKLMSESAQGSNIHIYWGYIKALGLPHTLENDQYSFSIHPDRVTNAICALETRLNKLTISQILPLLGLKEYLAALPDFSSSQDELELRLTYDKRAPAVARRFQVAQDMMQVAEQQIPTVNNNGTPSAPELPGISELYLMDEYFIQCLHPDADIRLNVAMIKIILHQVTSLRAQRRPTSLFDYWAIAEVEVAHTDSGVIKRVSDFFWHESPKGEVSQLSLPDLQCWFNDINAKQRTDILERAVREGTRSLSEGLPGQSVVQQYADGTILWCVGDIFWRASPDGNMSLPGVQDLLQHIDKISETQRSAILERATEEDAQLLNELDLRYLPRDSRKAAVLLRKMAAGGTGIDYALRHADWFKKYLSGLNESPLADSLLHLQPKELAALPSWIFAGMNLRQTNQLIGLLAPIWFSQNETTLSLPAAQDGDVLLGNLFSHPGEESATQRFAILEKAEGGNILRLSQVNPPLLPKDNKKMAIFLRKMTNSRTGIDYALRHADWFQKHLPDFDENPLAASLLSLKPEELAILPSWIFNKMSKVQTDQLIGLMTSIWFPADSGKANIIRLITLPAAIQNRAAAQITSCLKAAGSGQFNALSFENLLNISPQILQRSDLAEMFSGYFTAYAATGADIETSSLLRLPEFPDALLFILLQTMPPHKIFTAEASEKLFAHFLQKKLSLYQDIKIYLDKHPHYLRELGLQGIAALPQDLKEAISRQIDAYTAGNINDVSKSLRSALQQDREKRSTLTLKMIKMLSPERWQQVSLEIAPHELFAPRHQIGDTFWSTRMRHTLDNTAGKGALENYLNRYLDAHPHYLNTLGLDGIAQLPVINVVDLIRPQINAYIKNNIDVVRAALLANIDRETAEILSRPGLTLETSSTLQQIRLLPADILLKVLRNIPPDKFFPISGVIINNFGTHASWSWFFLRILQDIDESAADPIKKYVKAYCAAHPHYLRELDRNTLSQADARFRATLNRLLNN